MWLLPKGSISEAFQTELLGIIKPGSTSAQEMIYDSGETLEQMLKPLSLLRDIDSLEHEIKYILGKLNPDKPSNRILTIYPLVIGLKHYLISWSTLNDMMLYLVNMCFDLGLAKRDVNHGLIRRNSKVKDSQIIDILDIHKSNIDVSQTNKKRNDAAHRGKLLDSEIDEFQKKSKNLWSKKHSLLMINSSEQITDDEFNMQLRELNKQLANLVAIKHLEYSKHYERTLEMNKDLAKELARIYACRILKNKP